MKRTSLVLILAGCTASLHAQTPKFDVAALKALPEGTRFGPPSGGPGTQDSERFAWSATTLTGLLARAYGVSNDQISGPDWLGSQWYSITANIPAGATREQFQLMLQNLLAERLRIAVHHVTKTIEGYDLVIAKGGPKLKEPAPPDPARPNVSGQFGGRRSYSHQGAGIAIENFAVRDWVEVINSGERSHFGGTINVD